MKFIILSLLLICSLQAEKKQIHLVTETWPPYLMGTSEKPSGFIYDISKEVFEAIGYELKLEYYPWKRALNYCKNKECDGVLGIFKNEERRSFLYFPNEAVSEISYVIFARAQDPYKFTGLPSLKGKNIGVIRGYFYNKEFNEAKDFHLSEVGNCSQNIKKLVSKRVDLIVENLQVGLHVAKELKLDKDIKVLAPTLTKAKPFYLAFTHKEQHKELAEQFGAALVKFKKTKRYQEIMQSYQQSSN